VVILLADLGESLVANLRSGAEISVQR
jgi:hypothetical protein